MATIQFLQNNQLSPNNEVITATWAALTFAGSDVGAPLRLACYGDKTFQVFGTLGVGGSVVIEGSNDTFNWAPLSNRQGTAMAFTAGGFNTSQDKPVYVRPRITAGDGTTSLTIVCAAHRTDMPGVGA